MEFCPECDSILKITRNAETKEVVLKCPDCDYTNQDEKSVKGYVIKETVEHTEKDTIEIVEVSDDDDGISEEIREELTEQFRESIESFEF
jgi:DNA-directed RNA polymerase subunit M/transcription elongation factor TFIIS